MEAANAPWIELSSGDFVGAIQRLKPERMLKKYRAKQLQIGLDGDVAIFCADGVSIRCPATGRWNGLACISYGVMLPYLKVKPDTDRVRLAFKAGRLRIDSSSYSATWVETSPPGERMASEAHGSGTLGEPAPTLFCPRCGKREGMARHDLERRLIRLPAEDRLLAHLTRVNGSHGCGACTHAWNEI